MAITINGTTGIAGVDGSNTSPAIQGSDTNTGISFGTDTVNINTGGVTRAAITSTGRVGIGESSPITALHITGTNVESSRIRSTRSGSSAEFGVDASGHLVIDAKGSDGSNGEIRAYAGGSQRFKVALDGRFILGNPTVNTTVDHSLVAAGRIQTDGTYDATTSSSANIRIATNGLLHRVTSSARYKKDITDATWGLADVLKLKPKTFKSNATGEDADDNTYGGFIAEDVHDIGLTNFVEYNSDNQPDALHYGNMVSLLTKAIQELNTKITTLETKVAALEAG